MRKIIVGIAIFLAAGTFFAMVLSGVIGYIQILKQHGFDITIQNQTDKEITGLYITYQNILSDIPVPDIPAGQVITFNVTPTEEFGENSMQLYYNDLNGNVHFNRVIGYFEKGYFGEAIVTIKSMDENGVLQIEVEENLF